MVGFSIDCMPLSYEFESSDDYNGIIVYAAITDPLFRYDLNTKSYKNFACQDVDFSKDGKRISITLRNDLFFWDGTPVTALDYKCSIKKQMKIDPYNYRIIKKIICKHNVIIIHLKKRDLFIKERLSKINISPRRNQITSGPYYIHSVLSDKIICRRNPYYRVGLHNVKHKVLEFCIIDDPNKNIESYLNQKINITCNTLFPLNLVKKYSEDIHIYPSYIFVSMGFYSDKVRKNLNFRRFMSYIINKDEISSLLYNMVYPTDDYLLDSYQKSNIKEYNLEYAQYYLSQCDTMDMITLGYDDFYPNEIIAYSIANQLKNVGIEVEVVEECFSNPAYNCDIKLTLNYPHFIHNASFYISGMFLKLMRVSDKFAKYYKLCQNIESDNSDIDGGTRELCALIKQESVIIPIVKMNSIYLCSDSIRGFNYIVRNYESL